MSGALIGLAGEALTTPNVLSSLVSPAFLGGLASLGLSELGIGDVPDLILVVGGVPFFDLEVPPEITAGGAQSMHTHKYPGGVRTVDTMGPDDDVLRWGGWFEAILAEARARQMDQLRRQGNPVLVSWSSYIYMGVIKSFKFRYNRFFHIHYDLEIEVIQDIAAAGGSQSFLSSISSLVNGAMSSIQTGIDQIGQSFSNVASVASQL